MNQIQQVAIEQNRSLVELTDHLPLLESGLDSLCFAVIIARLEDLWGIDPFTNAGDARFPVTVGDLVCYYENALQ